MVALINTVDARLQSFLAFDFGIKRTGVAYASRLLGEAKPQGTIKAQGDQRWPDSRANQFSVGFTNGVFDPGRALG